MDRKEYRCVIVSDFTAGNFAGCLNNSDESPVVKSTSAPFDQVDQALSDGKADCWKGAPDFALIWTRPDHICRSFNQLVHHKSVPQEEIFTDVDRYSSLLLNACDRVKCIFVPTWVLPSYYRGLGMLDMKNGIGIANILMRMNLRLSENLDKASNIYLLNTQKWVEAVGQDAFSPKLWYMGKVAFGNEVFVKAVKDIKFALKGINGNSRKLIILDLDNTLWGGVIGDIGWKNIKLGGHDHIGEAYVDFQHGLKALRNRGILLGIVSKNEEALVLEAIDKHPEMALRLDDFAGWKINWNDKAKNIVDLVSDLNLTLQSAVFVDDNPAERSRVREELPEVLVPEWPESEMLYKSTLLGLGCFDTSSVSKEDFERTKMYAVERQRRDLRRKIGSLDVWLKNLKMRIEVSKLTEVNLPRAAQLLNKTNQMNLSTRRMTELELMTWAKQENRKIWTFRVSDKFGDLGLTGIISLERIGQKCKIVDFVLSCRAMGRKTEEVMLYIAIKYARSTGSDEVRAEYIRTERNKPCLLFFQASELTKRGTRAFIWKTDKKYRPPKYIEIVESNR